MVRTVYRIVMESKLDGAFTGEGARLHPGRWNHRGVPLVYCAQSVSLAALEILVHVENPDLLQRYVFIPVTFDEKICRELHAADLPEGWNAGVAPASTREIGSLWAKQMKSAVLAVPSAVVRHEMNYLINPLHPDTAKVKIGRAETFKFDGRMGSKRR